MKALVTLEGLLLLLFSWMWMCSGQTSAVLVECSYVNFRAVAKRALFYEDELVGPDELFLGTGCVANHVRPEELEFNYPISFCGIVPQIFFDGSVFHSWLTYKPRNQAISAEFHLQCMVPRNLGTDTSNDLPTSHSYKVPDLTLG
ncbi:oocyte-secreted protein 3-like [Sciurus carolinensis]|uniref:oocyte-secreted protein 3-like n=1 Tax=Sciurus carolinensis TaxID=30640 RepID=UPI001FB37DD9|nr:oocyte-secreted protein 3-like [Sciurus carolinensis]